MMRISARTSDFYAAFACSTMMFTGALTTFCTSCSIFTPESAQTRPADSRIAHRVQSAAPNNVVRVNNQVAERIRLSQTVVLGRVRVEERRSQDFEW